MPRKGALDIDYAGDWVGHGAGLYTSEKRKKLLSWLGSKL
jgi:hypothetical protein